MTPLRTLLCGAVVALAATAPATLADDSVLPECSTFAIPLVGTEAVCYDDDPGDMCVMATGPVPVPCTP